MNTDSNSPSGFILSDAAMYAFQCQEVFSDLLSFASAIPDHLKQLFLIPVYVQVASSESDSMWSIAARVAETGDSDAADLFSYQTFVNYDNEPSITPGNEGSIYDAYQTPDDIPVSQPGDQFVDGFPRYDAIEYAPSDTSFMTDGDSTDLLINEGYPYRMNEQVRHSFVNPVRIRMALKPEMLQEHAPEKTKNRARTCSVQFVSYYKPNRMYTFAVKCGHAPHMVRAVLSEIDEITMTCDCPFWRWGGPEFHAKTHSFLLGKPRGTATPPNVRDPDRKHWLCKHAYSVLRRLEHHVKDVIDEHWDEDEEDILNSIDSEWDRLSEEVEIPLEDIEEEDPILELTDEEEPELEPEPEPELELEPEPELEPELETEEEDFDELKLR
jgi:hypothetical protein